MIGLFGIVVAGVGIFFALYSLGFFNYLGGKRKSAIPAVSKDELLKNFWP